MDNTVRVLTSFFGILYAAGSEGSPEWFTSHPELREEIIQQEAINIADLLMESDEFLGIYDSFSDEAVDTSVSGGKVILGVEQPEKLIRECETWNESLRADSAYWLKKCEIQVPDGQSLSSWVQTADFMSMNDAAPWYRLAGAISSMNGKLNSTSPRYVCGVEFWDKQIFKVGYNCYYSTVMDPKVLASVKAHPEYYAIIELSCKKNMDEKYNGWMHASEAYVSEVRRRRLKPCYLIADPAAR